MATLLVLGAAGACRTKSTPSVSQSDGGVTTATTAGEQKAPARPSAGPKTTASSSARPLRVVRAPVPEDGYALSSLSPVRAAPRVSKSGDGCRTKRVFDAHGWMGEEPVRAKVEALGTHVTLRVSLLKSKEKRLFRATLAETLCAFPPSRVIEVEGRVDRGSAAAPAEHRLSFFEVPGCTNDGGRLKLEISDGSTTLLELRNTREDKTALHAAFQNALGTVDIEAALDGPNGSVFVVYLTIGERQLWLAELGGSPLSVRHETHTGLECRDANCEAALEAFGLPSGGMLVIPKLIEGGCTLRFYRATRAALWTFGSAGFGSGEPLPTTDEHGAGPDYAATSSETRLYWVGVEARASHGVLVRHSDTQVETDSYRLFLVDTKKNALEAIDAPLEVRPDALGIPPDAPPGSVSYGAPFTQF